MSTIGIKALKTTMPVIGFNESEIRDELIRLTEKYKGLVVTQETLKSCKTTQRELSSLRKQIDTYRKDIKREIKKPIDIFEGKCKDLINIVLEVENPIKESLVVFEEKRKEDQQLWVDDIVDEMIEKYQLGNKYSSRIIKEERFLNATITEKEVVDNIESQAKLLKETQTKVKDRYEMIIATLKMHNKDLITPLTMSDFQWMADKLETIDMDDALRGIDLRAKSQKATEEKAEQKAREVKPAEPIKVKEGEPEELPELPGSNLREDDKETVLVETFRITLICTREELTPIINFIKEKEHKIESVKRVNYEL
ncbi:MAG: DUF1351 domain-containing protein [Nanoarchaeota archaeon]|nr:DUF1351 domain-containing protein [Nanoarchaeota archaeon]